MDHLDYVDHLDPKHQMRMVKFQITIDFHRSPTAVSISISSCFSNGKYDPL